MTKKVASFKKSVRKAVVHRIVTAARAAKKSAQAVLITDRTLPPPVEIEPRCLDSPALLALKKELQRLVDEIAHQEVLIQDHPTTTTHMADDASDLTEQVTNLALRGNLEELLKEVEHAVGRAEQGTYGMCERCGKPIADERLRVVPSAPLCIDCAKLQIHSAKR